MVLPAHKSRAGVSSVFTVQIKGRRAQAEQQMQVIIAQSFCFEGLGHLNVTVYKWGLLEEIEQSDFKDI